VKHESLKRPARKVVLGGFVLLFVVAVLLGTSTGAAQLSARTVGAILLTAAGDFGIEPWWDEQDEVIVFQLRLPRVLLALLVGSTLAASGAAFQALFRNPMADPFILGVSPGAALGASIAMVLRLDIRLFGLSQVPLFAFGGGLLTSLLVYQAARRRQVVPIQSLLLTGIAVGSLLSALTSLLMVLSQKDMHHVMFWIMGGLSGRGWTHVYMVLPYALFGIVLILGSARDLNLILLGEEDAFHLGLRVESAKTKLLVASSLACAAAVAAAGVIGFVGLLVPHAVRLLTGPDHRFFLPVTVIAGGTTLALADVFARTLLPPQEVPLGVVTALMGAPVFLYLLRRRSGSE